jgi:cytidyltransferase-like protein
MKKNKIVYIGLSADTVHHGRMKLIEKARHYGDILIGLITDKALAEFKRLPYLNYEQRKKNFQIKLTKIYKTSVRAKEKR